MLRYVMLCYVMLCYVDRSMFKINITNFWFNLILPEKINTKLHSKNKNKLKDWGVIKLINIF